MYLMIDNYDSFVYNLVIYFKELGVDIEVKKNDMLTLEAIRKKNYKGIIISPGPKTPKEAGISKEVVKEFYDKIPILGICLGHQTIANVFGGDIIKGNKPMHGKISNFTHYNSPLFKDIPNTFSITRYHSLIADEKTFPKDLKIEGKSEDGVIMALSHRKFPVFGLQFHPEALLTEYGHKMLENFIKICEEVN